MRKWLPKIDKKTEKWFKYGAIGVGGLLLLRRVRLPARGAPISVWNTYYKLTDENHFGGERNVPLYDEAGGLIANVSQAFMTDFCIEGSGKLADGRVVNWAGAGTFSGTLATGWSGSCRATVLDPYHYPWGKGVQNRPLRPLKSIATDRRVIPWGSNVYIREFDGLWIPQVGGVGGIRHDGCFSADDTGGAIIGDHIDIFAGPNAMYHYLEGLFPTRTRLTAYVNSGRCG